MAQLSSALNMARAFLNDVNATVWSDPALIPLTTQAHYELQSDLWMNGSPVIRATTTPLLVAAGVSPDINAALPTDFLIPTHIDECGQATGAPDNLWIPMTEQFFFNLGQPLLTTLTWWSWQEEKLLFVGSSANRYVSIQYRRKIPVPQATTDPIGMTFGELYLGARAAAIAAGALGNAAAAGVLDGIAQTNFAKVLSANRGQQKPINKP